MEACAKELNCALSTISNEINHKLKAKPTPPKRPTVVLPRTLCSSAPMHKKINPIHRALTPPTKTELYSQLFVAWLNTAALEVAL